MTITLIEVPLTFVGRQSTRFREETYHALISFRMDCRNQSVDLGAVDRAFRNGVSDIAKLRLEEALLPFNYYLDTLDYLFSLFNYHRSKEVPWIPSPLSSSE